MSDWIQTDDFLLLHDVPYGSVALTRRRAGSHVASLRIEVGLEYRRQGHGRRLLREVIAFAPTVGIYRIEATPYMDNPHALSFFHGSDFEYEGVRRLGGKRGKRLVDTALYAWTVNP